MSARVKMEKTAGADVTPRYIDWKMYLSRQDEVPIKVPSPDIVIIAVHR